MMKHAVVLCIVALLCSCASTVAPVNVDWSALEADAKVTSPLEFKPQVEAMNFRIPLFNVESTGLKGTWKVVIGGSPAMRPFGVDLGNSLAIDSGGAVFLDVTKLLKVETGTPFRLERKADSLLGSRTLLTRDSNGLFLRSAHGRGPVVDVEGGIAVKNAGGGTDFSVTLADGTYTYKSTIPFDSDSRMQPTEDLLKIYTPLMHDLRIERRGEVAYFNPAADPDYPQYTVTKTGDSYAIRYQSSVMDITFKVYYTADSMYLVRNGIVTTTVKVTPASILLNGKEVVTYSQGG